MLEGRVFARCSHVDALGRRCDQQVRFLVATLGARRVELAYCADHVQAWLDRPGVQVTPIPWG